jgi:hypothetical protein
MNGIQLNYYKSNPVLTLRKNRVKVSKKEIKISTGDVSSSLA